MRGCRRHGARRRGKRLQRGNEEEASTENRRESKHNAETLRTQRLAEKRIVRYIKKGGLKSAPT